MKTNIERFALDMLAEKLSPTVHIPLVHEKSRRTFGCHLQVEDGMIDAYVYGQDYMLSPARKILEESLGSRLRNVITGFSMSTITDWPLPRG